MVLRAFNQSATNLTSIKNLLMAAAGTALITLGIGETTQAATIDTTSSWDGFTYVFPLGESNTGTYGQTFTVPETDNVITSFTFFLDEYEGSDVVDFAAYLMKWDGTKATGSILYESDVQSTDNVSGFQEFTFNTGEISLNSGEQYVAFLSASNFFDGEDGTAIMGYLGNGGPGDVYSGGGFFFLNNGSDFNLLTTTSWETFIGNGLDDTAFRITFQSPTSVPEPLSLGGITVAGLLGMWLTKKQAARKSHQCT